MNRYPASLLSAVLTFAAAVPSADGNSQPAEGTRAAGIGPNGQGMATAVPTITPVFGQLVLFTLPAHFVIGSDQRNGGFYIREHVPAGESVESWSTMITLTGFKDLTLNPAASLPGYLGKITSGYESHCPGTYAVNQLGPQTVDGREAFAVVVSCGSVTEGASSHSESAVLLGIKGTADYYTLQWAERGAPSDKPMNLPAAYWTARLSKLYPIKLCAIVPGERAPYSSCVNRK
jgi:hypothetical protein